MTSGAAVAQPRVSELDRASELPRASELMIHVAGTALPLCIRRNARARRMVLRLAGSGDGLVLTLPVSIPVAEGLAMIERERTWIERRLQTMPPRQPFVDGASIPVLGETLHIRHRADRKAGVARVGDAIEVGGPADRLADRLTRWLRAMALADLVERSGVKAGRLGRTVRSVRVREMRSRWGSCSARGDLSYNWRLIMAPPPVVDYVAAHEVAHLACRGHDSAFWATVERLASDVASARAWLRSEGGRLMSYG